jgi:DNA polymerase II small subunit
VPLESTARIVRELADRGYNAEREAVTLLAGAADPQQAIDHAVETAPDDELVLSTEHVRSAIDDVQSGDSRPHEDDISVEDVPESASDDNPSVSTGTDESKSAHEVSKSPAETEGYGSGAGGAVTEVEPESGPTEKTGGGGASAGENRNSQERAIAVSGDIRSTGTGEYADFVSVFRDRYEKLAAQLRGRVNHRPTDTIAAMSPGSETGLIGMVVEVRTTASGHWLLELEDTNGTFPCLIMKDREFVDDVRNTLTDEVIAVEGTLSDDTGILFVDELYLPDVPRTHSPSTADRPVEAALISDVHVGSEEFLGDAWDRFADWLHTEEAASVEYLLICGDMVEGVGVYPDQDEELEIVDIYDQYEAFSEHLKDVPGDLEIVMIPGNHDAVRLAEPQPAFDENLREIMTAHDATISANPSTVTIEGVSVLMYHGVSLDEVIAELPDDSASYERPHDAMKQLLKKRHVAPQYGGNTRIAPEEEDHLVMEEVPDIFHTGHVHKLGYGSYHNVLMINSSCWQAQTDFQKSVNLDPDVGYAPIVDLQTLDLTVRQFV